MAAKAVLFTLAFRIGSNPFSWISQKELSIELDISESNVRRHMKKIQTEGLISIQEDPKDKRKNIYLNPPNF